MKYSAGIIPFRFNSNNELEFFVGHPGGKSWQNRDYWAYLKGGVEDGEDNLKAAIREFREESSINLEGYRQSLIPLGTSIQNPKKTVIAYAIHYPDIDPSGCYSNMADNGLNPEIDKYRWMTYEQLKKCTHPMHIVFYERIGNLKND